MTLDPTMLANVLHQQRVEALLIPVLREQQAATPGTRTSPLDRVRTTVAGVLIALGEALQPRTAPQRRASI